MIQLHLEFANAFDKSPVTADEVAVKHGVNQRRRYRKRLHRVA